MGLYGLSRRGSPAPSTGQLRQGRVLSFSPQLGPDDTGNGPSDRGILARSLPALADLTRAFKSGLEARGPRKSDLDFDAPGNRRNHRAREAFAKAALTPCS